MPSLNFLFPAIQKFFAFWGDMDYSIQYIEIERASSEKQKSVLDRRHCCRSSYRCNGNRLPKFRAWHGKKYVSAG